VESHSRHPLTNLSGKLAPGQQTGFSARAANL
jgi:hypothetical protein